MDGIIEAAQEHIPYDETRYLFYKDVIPVLEREDWDTPGECMGNDDAFDKAMRELHPNWF